MSCLRLLLMVVPPGKEEGGGRHQAGGGGQPRGQAGGGARGRTRGSKWEVVDLRVVGQQKEGVEPLQSACRAGAAARAVEVGILDALAVKPIDPIGGALLQLLHLAKL